MEPDQQLEQLATLLKEINKGNATKDEVVELFGVLERAIKQIRADLETKIGETGNESRQETLTFLEAAEARLSDVVSKAGEASKSDLTTLRNDIKAQIEAVRKLIPKLPDFQGMIDEIEDKIPEIPEPIEYKAGRNIEIEGDTIINTNPKITVSREKPSNPQEGDLWIRI